MRRAAEIGWTNFGRQKRESHIVHVVREGAFLLRLRFERSGVEEAEVTGVDVAFEGLQPIALALNGCKWMLRYWVCRQPLLRTGLVHRRFSTRMASSVANYARTFHWTLGC